jgi:hypothetical protein
MSEIEFWPNLDYPSYFLTIDAIIINIIGFGEIKDCSNWNWPPVQGSLKISDIWLTS